jgi:hypothetical protein
MVIIAPPTDERSKEIELHTNQDYEKFMDFIEKNKIDKILTAQYKESVGALMENKRKTFTAVFAGLETDEEDPYLLHFLCFATTPKKGVKTENLQDLKGKDELLERNIFILSFTEIDSLMNYLVSIADANDITADNAVIKFDEPNPITVLICEGVTLARKHKLYPQLVLSTLFGGPVEQFNNLIAIADIITNEKQKRNITYSSYLSGKLTQS